MGSTRLIMWDNEHFHDNYNTMTEKSIPQDIHSVLSWMKPHTTVQTMEVFDLQRMGFYIWFNEYV